MGCARGGAPPHQQVGRRPCPCAWASRLLTAHLALALEICLYPNRAQRRRPHSPRVPPPFLALLAAGAASPTRSNCLRMRMLLAMAWLTCYPSSILRSTVRALPVEQSLGAFWIHMVVKLCMHVRSLPRVYPSFCLQRLALPPPPQMRWAACTCCPCTPPPATVVLRLSPTRRWTPPLVSTAQHPQRALLQRVQAATLCAAFDGMQSLPAGMSRCCSWALHPCPPYSSAVLVCTLCATL